MRSSPLHPSVVVRALPSWRGRLMVAVFAAGLLTVSLGAVDEAQAQLVPPSPGLEASPQKATDRGLSLEGYLRVRSDLFYNLDLDRGPTPSGQLLFPLPTSNPAKQTLQSANTRLRLEPVWQLGSSVRLLARVDVLDNVVLGSTPRGLPRTDNTPMVGATVAQAPPVAGKNSWVDSVAVKRVWGEVLLPFGLLSIGRQGAVVNWGTGFFVNSGRHLDADGSDAADRVSFATSLLGHLWLVAFDWSATGPVSPTRGFDAPSLNLDNKDDVLTWSFGVARYHTDAGIKRRLRAGSYSINYGLLGSYRKQDKDVPGYYTEDGFGQEYGANAYVFRGNKTVTGDLWFRFQSRRFRIELEAAVLYSQVANASLDPSVELRRKLTSLQYGGVLQTAWRPFGGGLSTGVEVGLASGDSAPGFGVSPSMNQRYALPGDIDGPQFRLPGDKTVNNFRFHRDYHVDLILWRQILGTVTDAVYFRPWVRWQSSWGLRLEGVLVSSFALHSESTPGGESPLGVEVDVLAAYRYDKAFDVRVGLGTLFPLAGLSNIELNLDAKPAMTVHTVVAYVF